MKCDRQTMRLYAVTDRAWVGRQTLPEQVEAALKGGATCVQLREKELDGAAFLEEARTLAALCRRYGVPLIINDNVEVALAAGAADDQGGQEDLTGGQGRRLAGDRLIVGVSAHTVEQALAAQAGGADYLGVGAVFATATKSDAHVLPRETLAEICRAVDIPVVAIGGIGEDNLLQLAGTGVDGAALVSAIFSALDIEGQCRKLRALSERMVKA